MSSDKRELAISKTLSLPTSAVTQKEAFLGNSGSGKTYGAGKFVEELLGVGAQVVVIDTVGNWYGLRLARDGRSPGIKIPIVGGLHGDIPLAPEHGAIIATTVAETKSSLIIDVSDFTDGETRKFVEAFARVLLAEKKKHPSPLKVVWEECQDLVPQRVFGEDARMVGAIQKLVKKGRNYGVGTTLISQRSAAVNKEVLNLIETLFAFRTAAKLDRDAIDGWVNYKNTGSKEASQITSKLPELETGSCVVYSPQWLGILTTIKFAAKRTFDASATPDFDTNAEGVKLATIDMGALRAKLDSVVVELKANDVGELKKKLREYQTELSNLRIANGKLNGTSKTTGGAELAEAIAPLRSKIIELELRNSEISIQYNNLLSTHRDLKDAAQRGAEILGQAVEGARVITGPTDPIAITSPKPKPKTDAAFFRSDKTATEGDLSKMERRILTVLAQHSGGLTKQEIQTHTGYAASGKLSTAYAAIIRNGYVYAIDSKLMITGLGIHKLGDFEPLPQGKALLKHLLEGHKLSTMEKNLLQVIAAAPGEISKGDALVHAGYSASGKVSTAFARLTRMRYIVKTKNAHVKLGEELRS